MHKRLIHLHLILVLALAISGCASTADATVEPSHLAAAAGQKETDDQQITVYVTNTGEKYHRGSCQHLRRSKTPISLSVAKAQGYEACKVCRPAR